MRHMRLRGATTEVLQIATPRDFQYKGIYHAAFNDDTFLVINRGTADDKTLVP